VLEMDPRQINNSQSPNSHSHLSIQHIGDFLPNRCLRLRALSTVGRNWCPCFAEFQGEIDLKPFDIWSTRIPQAHSRTLFLDCRSESSKGGTTWGHVCKADFQPLPDLSLTLHWISSRVVSVHISIEKGTVLHLFSFLLSQCIPSLFFQN
jgi:hypothetical protein